MPTQPRDPLEWERQAFPHVKKLWMKIKSSKMFEKFRRSKLNPYHRGVMEIEAENLREAEQIARKKIIEKLKNDSINGNTRKSKNSNLTKNNDFIYKGTRYNVEQSCSVQEEFARDGVVLRGGSDVSDSIPRDENGKLDLLAEDPIVFAIVPFEGPALVGHVGIQYQDMVLNRLIPSIHTDPIYPKYKENAEYYFVYPSQLGIDPKKLKREIEKYNIKYARKKYNLITNNCARNVGDILKKMGVKDIDFYGFDDIGLVFTNPGNNPWGKGIKGWCLKHGIHVNTTEVEAFHEKYNFDDVKERRKRMDEIHERYEQYKSKKRLLPSLLQKIHSR